LVRREALGKGVGALFSDQAEPETEVISKKSEVDPPETPVITNESEVISKKLEVNPPETPVITNESEVISKKSEVNPPETPVITNESEVISKKSEVTPPELLVITNEEVISKKLEVTPPELLVITNESEVISKKSEVNPPESEVITSAEKNKNQKQRPGSKGPKRKQRSPATKTKQNIEAIDPDILEQAVTEGLESPRLSTWSPPVMSALRYLQLTTGRFSMSREVSETLEAAFREKYPALFERIEKEIGER